MSSQIIFDFKETENTENDDDGQQPMILDDNFEEEDSSQQPNKERITKPIMTRFERTRIIGTRAMHLCRGAQPLVNPEGEMDPLVIAEKELDSGVIPMSIRRYLPGGQFEDWPLKEFDNI